MHESVLDFVKRHTRDLPDDITIRVLDVGSFDINGSARSVLTDVDYTGVDLHAGPGVDVVADAHELTKADLGTFDLVLCLEMLEHDTQPWTTAAQLAKMAKPDGRILVTARGNGFTKHNEPDCYRFLEDGFRAVLEAGGLTVDELRPDPQASGWFARCSVTKKAAPRKKPTKADADG